VFELVLQSLEQGIIPTNPQSNFLFLSNVCTYNLYMMMSILESYNLLSIRTNHIVCQFLLTQTTSPAWQPCAATILMRQRFMDPFHPFIQMLCWVAILVKYFQPLVHEIYVLFSLSPRVSVIMNLPPLIIVDLEILEIALKNKQRCHQSIQHVNVNVSCESVSSPLFSRGSFQCVLSLSLSLSLSREN